MRIVAASDSSILVAFAEDISAETQRNVLSLFLELQKLRDLRIRNLHPAYSSLLIDFDSLLADHAEITRIVKAALTKASLTADNFRREVRIPVCYHDEFAPDLNVVAEKTGLSENEVVRLHSTTEYVVAFLGFTPGFGYLSGLPDRLSVPRRETPRKVVAAGSVGIAGIQTGVYPLPSPGGWQIIGRTPLRMFHPDANPPTLLQSGDVVRFVPISIAEFANLSRSEGANR